MAVMFCLLALGAYVLFKWSVSTFDFFKKQGIPYRKPFPLLGTVPNLVWNKKPINENLDVWYYEYPDEKISGLFEFRRPLVFVRDPKIAKYLAVKEFDHFSSRRAVIDEKVEPLVGKSLFSLNGMNWKDMRATLSPAFTGSKMRQMFDLMSEVGLQTVTSMKDQTKPEYGTGFEFKKFASKFTVDIIATCAFGIEVDSFKNPDNGFQQVATKITNLSTFKNALKLIGFMTVPKVMKKLKIGIFDKKVRDFFRTAIAETMEIREKNGIIRHDLINLLMQAKKGQLAHESNAGEKAFDGFATVEESQIGKLEVKRVWTDDDFAAQCFVFFLGGFDSVAATMSFLAYELVVNPDIQQKLYEEISEMNNQLDGKKITYEQIQGLEYLDQAISETLRKWPITLPVVERLCVKDYDLEYEGKTLHFSPDLIFVIPTWSFHRDPKYFPEPERFDPDRFNGENRKNIDPDTYLSFGIGPRNCIGSRFALLEMKTMFYFMLLNFKFETCEKTQIPLQFSKHSFFMKPEKEICIALKPREI